MRLIKTKYAFKWIFVIIYISLQVFNSIIWQLISGHSYTVSCRSFSVHKTVIYMEKGTTTLDTDWSLVGLVDLGNVIYRTKRHKMVADAEWKWLVNLRWINYVKMILRRFIIQMQNDDIEDYWCKTKEFNIFEGNIYK